MCWRDRPGLRPWSRARRRHRTARACPGPALLQRCSSDHVRQQLGATGGRARLGEGDGRLDLAFDVAAKRFDQFLIDDRRIATLPGVDAVAGAVVEVEVLADADMFLVA